MVRFDPADPFDHEIPASEPRGAEPVALPRRRSRRLVAPSFQPTNQLIEQMFPSWARIDENAVRAGDPAFFAGAGLALLDHFLAASPPFAGALRQRLALRAAAACVKMARLREDAAGLRDAEHLAPGAGTTQTSLAGRIHRLWRLFASRPLWLDASTLRIAADLVGLTDSTSFDGLAAALRDIVAGAEHPLAAAVGASAAAMKLLTDTPPVDVEIFAFWLSDLALAQRLRRRRKIIESIWSAGIP